MQHFFLLVFYDFGFLKAKLGKAKMYFFFGKNK